MKVLNFGSLNIDHVYCVDHFVRPGETLAGQTYRQFSGGKGFNQSVALGYAGVETYHAGKIGQDGLWLKEKLQQCGVHTDFLRIEDGSTGHALIQVNADGENAIILFGGANRHIASADIEVTLAAFAAGDFLLLQNEINAIPEIIRKANDQGMHIIFNPAPMSAEVLDYPLDLVDTFIVNEIEGVELCGERKANEDAVLAAMQVRFPGARVVLTLGSHGVRCREGDQIIVVPAEEVEPVDTTAAGDTFIGYFLAGIIQGINTQKALERACKAAAICVTRHGAADAIPRKDEVIGLYD